MIVGKVPTLALRAEATWVHNIADCTTRSYKLIDNIASTISIRNCTSSITAVNNTVHRDGTVVATHTKERFRTYCTICPPHS